VNDLSQGRRWIDWGGAGEGEERASAAPVILQSSIILHHSSHRCPTAERNDPADQVDCGAVQLSTAKGAKSVLHHPAQSQDQRKTTSALELCAQLEFQSTG
jgi:hypothetical protein